MINYDELFMAQRAFSIAATAPAPAGWSQFSVKVEATSEGHRVLVEGPSLLAADDAIHGPAREILRIHADGGHPLESFTYTFTRKPDGGWKGVGDFEYP